MKRNWVYFVATNIFLGIVAVTGSEPAAAPAPVPTRQDTNNGPRINFEQTVFDFGKISPTEVVKHEFIFSNAGNAVLHVTDVKPGCGCTTAGEWDREVQPGKTGKIPVQFNPGSFSGIVGKSITVFSDDPTKPQTYLTIKGTIWRPIDVIPPNAFIYVTEGFTNAETRVVRIINNMEEPITVCDLACTNKAFDVSLKETKPGHEFEISITVKPPLPSQYVQCPVTAKTSSSNMPTVSINAFAMVQPVIQTIPQPFYLPGGALPANNVYTVTVRNNSGTSMALSDPSINVDGATVKVLETQPGRMFNIQVSFPAGFQIQPGQKVEITAKSTLANHPVVKIPVLQLPAPASFQRPPSPPQPPAKQAVTPPPAAPSTPKSN